VVIVHRDAELLEVALARRASSRFASLLNGGQQQCNQHSDDGNDDQQFYQRESPVSSFRHGTLFLQ
jgi:hypothetical protein